MSVPNNSRIIVDGYNVIFVCGLMNRKPNRLALEAARNRLLRILAKQLSDTIRSKTMVVFDARQTPIREDQSLFVERGITIVFSAEYEDADSLIEELIRQHPSPKQLAVVSSDLRIQQAAQKRKATTIASDDWLDQLEGGVYQEEQPAEDLSGSKEIPIDLEKLDWSKEFEFDDDDF